MNKSNFDAFEQQLHYIEQHAGEQDESYRQMLIDEFNKEMNIVQGAISCECWTNTFEAEIDRKRRMNDPKTDPYERAHLQHIHVPGMCHPVYGRSSKYQFYGKIDVSYIEFWDDQQLLTKRKFIVAYNDLNTELDLNDAANFYSYFSGQKSYFVIKDRCLIKRKPDSNDHQAYGLFDPSKLSYYINLLILDSLTTGHKIKDLKIELDSSIINELNSVVNKTNE